MWHRFLSIHFSYLLESHSGSQSYLVMVLQVIVIYFAKILSWNDSVRPAIHSHFHDTERTEPITMGQGRALCNYSNRRIQKRNNQDNCRTARSTSLYWNTNNSHLPSFLFHCMLFWMSCWYQIACCSACVTCLHASFLWLIVWLSNVVHRQFL